jgi:pectinesterase
MPFALCTLAALRHPGFACQQARLHGTGNPEADTPEPNRLRSRIDQQPSPPSRSAVDRPVLKILITLFAMFCCYAAEPVVASPAKTLTLGLIGDSTVASTYGWGPALADRLNDRATVLNFAKNGATLDSLSKKLDELIARKPDYILIQFGHNDMKRYDTEAYGKKLADYVERITKAGIKAIVLSSVTRRKFDEHGKIAPRIIDGRSLPDYALAAKAVAEQKHVPFIDLNTISIAHHNKIGPKASAAYHYNETDTTHFSKAGAKATAGLILPELISVAPDVADVVKPSKK